MDVRKKSLRTGSLLLALLFIAGLLLLYEGNDAIALAVKKKEGILTAEQVKLSFNSVGGRLVNEAVKEAQEVKQGDVVMELDSTDVDLAIEKLEAQIAQLQAQISAIRGTIDIDYAKTDTSEQQSFRQIDQQRAALESAKATYANKQLDFNRKAELASSGAISRSELDDARTSLDVAAANAAQQQQLLAQLLAGASYEDDAPTLPTIAQRRAEIANQRYNVENLEYQKKALEVELKELKIKKQRLTLRVPEDGRILKILVKQGEMIAPSSPVILLESKRLYYDIYIDETQAAGIAEGAEIVGRAAASSLEAPGVVRLVTAAPGFADLKMSREKGQADLSAFQVRIYTEAREGILPGMTIEVTDDAFAKR